MRHTSSHSKNRRSHHALDSKNLIRCKNCNSLKLRHRVCKECGYYRGKKIVDLVKKIERKQKRTKAKERISE